MFVGFGTLINVIAVVVGSSLGMAMDSRIPRHTKETMTAALAIFAIVIAGFSLVALESANLHAAVGQLAAVVVLLCLVFGTLLGSWLQIEQQLERGAQWIKNRLISADDSNDFISGWVTSTLVFCVGPLTIVGSISEGLGQGPQQLLIKSALDCFTALAFASTMGWGVLASALSIAVVEGSLTLLGYLAGDILSPAQIDALSATGGIILIGLGIRMLELKHIRVGDMLPALLIAPLGVQLASSLAALL